jgi:hypothetical protein
MIFPETGCCALKIDVKKQQTTKNMLKQINEKYD